MTLPSIAFIVRKVPPTIDGVGAYTFHLAKALKNLGCRVSIFTGTDQMPNENWIFPVVEDWSGPSVYDKVKRYEAADWVSLQYVPQLYGKYGICSKTAALPAFFSKHHIKATVTFHEVMLDKAASVKQILLKIIMAKQAKQLMRGSAVCFTANPRYLNLLKQADSAYEKTYLLPIGSNIPFAETTAAEKQNLRHRIAPEGEKIIGLFGRMPAYRNMDAALRLLKQANAHKIAAKIVLIGCGPESDPEVFRAWTRKADSLKLSGQITVTGVLDEKEVSHYLQILDLLLFPQKEGLTAASGTFAAAAEHGLWIAALAPAAGNLNSVYPRALLAMSDEALCQTVLKHLQSPQTAEEKTALNYFRERLSWPKIAEQYLKELNRHEN